MKRYRQSSSLVCERIEDELLIVPLQDGVAVLDKFQCLNGVGAFIWEQLKKEISVEEICQRVTSHYEVDPERARKDIQAFLQQMLELGLVQAHDD